MAYTGGPIPYGYYGLGDLLVFIFFGLVAVCGTYYVQAGTVSRLAVWSSLPMGFLIVGILVVNNLRDIHTDQVAGKRTLAVRLGARGARREFTLVLAAAYLISPVLWLGGIASVWVMLSWLSLPLAARLLRRVWTDTGRPLNLALAAAGQLTLVYGVLFSIGLIL
jgi:1,4-dihydroxy-2-naphthoate octaprenyltransferase